jgi:outer membrane protein assembly factor BamB
MIAKPFRITAMLALLANSSLGFSQDEGEPAEQLTATAAEAEGNMVFTIPALKQLWESQSVLNTSRDKVAHFSADEDIVFVQSSAGTITALNAESGRRMWSAQIGRSDEVAMQVTSDSQFAAVVAGPVIHTFDKFSGQKLFAYRLPESPSGPPLITRREIVKNNSVRVERKVFVPLADRSVVAYDIEQLTYLGRHGEMKKGVVRAMDWKYRSGELTRFAPAAGIDRVVVSSERGNLHILNMSQPDAGKVQFQFFMNSRTTAPLTIVTREDREYLLAACDNNRLFCIFLRLYGALPANRVNEGDLNWTLPLSNSVTQPVVVVGQDVFVLSTEGELRKFSLDTGNPVDVNRGAQAIAAQSEGVAGAVPVYGAAVDFSVKGPLALTPIRVTNRSTGQIVTSVILNLVECATDLTFAAEESGDPVFRISGKVADQVGFRGAKLSEDRKVLTIELADFQPGESFEFLPDFQHPELPESALKESDLAGGEVSALVSPVRLSVLASVSQDGRIEPLSPRTIIGRWKNIESVWMVDDVKSLAAVSRNAVHFINGIGELVSVNRETAESRVSIPVRDYTIQIANDLTDRIYMSTSSGRVVCMAEQRFEMGVMPIPVAGALSWIFYPKQELAPEFATYHQNPGRRPLMPDVPKRDAAAPQTDSSETTP